MHGGGGGGGGGGAQAGLGQMTRNIEMITAERAASTGKRMFFSDLKDAAREQARMKREVEAHDLAKRVKKIRELREVTQLEKEIRKVEDKLT
jgi:hypothetical protein